MTTRLPLALALLAVLPAASHARRLVVAGRLAATAVAPAARGKAILVIRKTGEARFDVTLRRLARGHTYVLTVGNVRLATFAAGTRGRAHLRFATRPAPGERLLGADPRGLPIAVRGGSGDDVLTGTVPTRGRDAGDVACCLPDDTGPECEDRTPAECASQGGTPAAAARSCLPDPCGGVPVDRDVVCCLVDDSGAECEDRTIAECAAQGAMAIEAIGCLPDPCLATPAPEADVVCCLPDDSGPECEDRTAADCVAAGGTVVAAATCTPDPCGG